MQLAQILLFLFAIESGSPNFFRLELSLCRFSELGWLHLRREWIGEVSSVSAGAGWLCVRTGSPVIKSCASGAR